MAKFNVEGTEFYCRGKILKTCGLASAWYEPVIDPESVISKLRKHHERLDIFTFFQRVPDTLPKFKYRSEPYVVAVIQIKDFQTWLRSSVGKKTRQAIRRSVDKGVSCRVVELTDEFVDGMTAIYNETPIRQGKKFPHFSDSVEKVRREAATFLDRSVFVGAYLDRELVGFMKLVFEEQFTDVLSLLSKQAHRDKAVNNALIAHAVDLCAARGKKYLVYGELGSGSLDAFKRHNGFAAMELPRYFVPLSPLGSLAVRFGLHKRVADRLPGAVRTTFKDVRRWWYEVVVRR